MKEVKFCLFKGSIRFTFPTETERITFALQMEEHLSKSTLSFGICQSKKFYKMFLREVSSDEIGETFRLLEKLGYEIPE